MPESRPRIKIYGPVSRNLPVTTTMMILASLSTDRASSSLLAHLNSPEEHVDAGLTERERFEPGGMRRGRGGFCALQTGARLTCFRIITRSGHTSGRDPGKVIEFCWPAEEYSVGWQSIASLFLWLVQQHIIKRRAGAQQWLAALLILCYIGQISLLLLSILPGGLGARGTARNDTFRGGIYNRAGSFSSLEEGKKRFLL